MPAGCPFSAMRPNLVPAPARARPGGVTVGSRRAAPYRRLARAGPHCRHAPDRRPARCPRCCPRRCSPGVPAMGPSPPSRRPLRRHRRHRADGPVADLHMVCAGEGSPTVVLIAGLDTCGDTFDDVQDRLAPTARTCWYDRAGIGDSRRWPTTLPTRPPDRLRPTCGPRWPPRGSTRRTSCSGGRTAAWSRRLTPRRTPRISPVWSSRTPRSASSSPTRADRATTLAWMGRGRTRRSTPTRFRNSWPTCDFGDLPVVVLSQDPVRGKFRRRGSATTTSWRASSTDGVHVVGIGSGHVMHEDVPDLVVASVEAVWTAAAQGFGAGPLRRPLHRCGRSLPQPGRRHAAAPPGQTPDGAADGGGCVSRGPGRTARCR